MSALTAKRENTVHVANDAHDSGATQSKRGSIPDSDATIAVRARDGTRVWRFPAGKYANPVVADEDRIYITGRSMEFALEERGRAAQERRAKKEKRDGNQRDR